MSSGAFVGALGAGVLAVGVTDVATKQWARTHAPTPDQLRDPLSPIPQSVHQEHAGSRSLGIAVALAPTAVAGATALALTRFGGPARLAAAGAVAMSLGAVLNGAELVARGSNTNVLNSLGVQANVADLAVVAGAGALGAAALATVLRRL